MLALFLQRLFALVLPVTVQTSTELPAVRPCQLGGWENMLTQL